MRRYKIVLACMMAAVMLFGCKNKEEPDPQPVEKTEAEPEEEEEIIQAEAPDVEQIPEGSVKSYLTGEYVSEAIGNRRPVAVMLNNVKAAVPQAGIANAGVVYEAPVEGGITRLMGIFEDYDSLEKIGSIRSCRTYYISYAMEFDAIYSHFGQAVYAVETLNDDAVNNISGLASQEGAGPIDGYAGEDIFYRSKDRKAPHNAYTSAEGIAKAIEKKGYRTEYAADYNGHYQFVKVGETVNMDGGVSATYVNPHYDVNEPWFEYDEETKMYKRFQYGKEQIDQLTDEQLTYKNILIQISTYTNYDENGYLNIDCTSGGAGKYITDGKAIDVTWKKDSQWGPTRYYDANGSEIKLNTGKTWVCIVLDSKAAGIEITGSQTDAATQSQNTTESQNEAQADEKETNKAE